MEFEKKKKERKKEVTNCSKLTYRKQHKIAFGVPWELKVCNATFEKQ